MGKILLMAGIVLVCLVATLAGIWFGPLAAIALGLVGGAVVGVLCWRACHAPRALGVAPA